MVYRNRSTLHNAFNFIRIFHTHSLTKNILTELEYLVKSKSLFGRKFEENCGGLDNLLKMINE